MPTEFRQIPDAPLYQMDKDGNIEKIDNGSPIFPFPLKSNNIKLLVDGERKSFLVDQLLKTVWGNVATKTQENKDTEKTKDETVRSQSVTEGTGIEYIAEIPEKNDRAKDTEAILISGDIMKDNDKSGDIMKLNCSMAIKIWKLHQDGVSIKDIKQIVKHPYSVSVSTTIERYQNNEKLRQRADSIKG